MTQGLESVTTAILGLAMDAASLRQQAIAANIANANTAGYVPQGVSFEAQLGDARRGLRTEGHIDPFALAGVKVQMQALQSGAQTGSIQLDTEVAALSQNTMQYQVLAKGLNKHFAILESAFSDGKR
jgi:flagellar basal-body rod protein FlgB